MEWGRLRRPGGRGLSGVGILGAHKSGPSPLHVLGRLIRGIVGVTLAVNLGIGRRRYYYGATGRRKRPLPAQPYPRPYGYEGASQVTS